MADEQTTRQRLLARWAMLSLERQPWMTKWHEVSTYLMPANGRFVQKNRDGGPKSWNKIYDSTGTNANRTLGAGLMSGATSPARPWFRLTTPNLALNANQDVKIWLEQLGQLMHKVFQGSNTYESLQKIYGELGAFGTGATVILPDFNNVIHTHFLTVGQYCIATDAQGQVVTLYRRFGMQVSQMVKEFGFDACSVSVQNLFNNAQLDSWIDVQHSIEPRADRDPAMKDAKNMPWGSWYFEVDASGDKLLRESGFKRFPAVCPRWSVTGEDVYGTGPGIETLGDVKGLQHKQLRKAQAIDYQTNPPLTVPTGFKNKDFDRLPGGISYVDQTNANAAVKSLFEVNLEMQYLLQDIAQDQQRIREGFYADLFLMLANADDQRMTATEVAARQEEKMLMLGPVFSRLSNELFKPLIEMTFDYMVEAGMVPPAPKEMQGLPLQVEYSSVLAQAQQAVGTNSIDRFVGALTSVAQTKPEVLDKFDSDAWADSYGSMLGIPPQIVLSSDKVQELRDARAKAQAAQQQAAVQEQMSKTAKNLGQTPTTGPANAAMDMMNQYSGYGTSAGPN